jgi:hypothetical protein
MMVRGLLISAAFVALALPAAAQDKTFNLKLSHCVPATHPIAEDHGGMGRIG